MSRSKPEIQSAPSSKAGETDVSGWHAATAASPLRRRTSVAMIVLDSVLRDARVLKEAATLRSQGYDVTIYGFADSADDGDVDVTLANGVRIHVFGRPESSPAARVKPHADGLETCGAGLRRFAGWFQKLSSGDSGWRPARKVAAAIHVRWRVRVWASRVLAELDRSRPDFVHCHDVEVLPVGAAFRQRRSCRLIYDSHELPEHRSTIGPIRRWRIIRRQRRYAALVDGFITVNDAIAEHFRDHYPLMPEAAVVMNATSRRAQPVAYDGRLHRAAGLPEDRKILLFQGGLMPSRGLAQLVTAAVDLPTGWHVVLMGWGSLEPELRRLRDRLPGGADKVRFLPPAPQSELAGWTSGASAGAIPYENTCLNHWYCSPNKLWEYPNAGVPVLASRFPVMERVVRGGGTGWLLEQPVTPRGIVTLVGSLTDAELAEKRANCAAFIRRDNWELYEGRLVDLYRRLEHRAGAGGRDIARRAA